jgi:hypothetical protein
VKKCAFASACLLSVVLLIACQRSNSVHAGNDLDYKPRPVKGRNVPMNGELIHVDKNGKNIAIRVENGMVQTFRIDSGTLVEGRPANRLRGLTGKEGSEVAVRWKEQEDDGKLATNIDVTQLIISKKRSRRR